MKKNSLFYKILAISALFMGMAATTRAATTQLWQGGVGQSSSSACELLEGTTSQLAYSRLPCGPLGSLLQSTGNGLQYVATNSLGITANVAWGGITGTLSNQTDLQTALNALVSHSYASSTFPTFLYSSSTFPSFTYASSTYYFASNPSGYITNSALNAYVPYTYASSTFPTYTYATNTYMTYPYATSTFAQIANVPTYTYASSTYYFASNPSNYITASALSPYMTFTYGSSTFPSFIYASATFPSFTYGSSTYYLATNPSGYITNSVSNLTNYPTYAYASSTYASTSWILNNFVPYIYASSTFPSFTYATNTFATIASLASYLTSATAASTYVPYNGATSDTNLGNYKLTVSGTSTLATTSISKLSLGDGLVNGVLAVDSNGNVISTTTAMGTVTSVGLTAPTGLTVSNSPITSSGNIGLALTSGYIIPLSASTTNWETFFDASATLPYYPTYGYASSTYYFASNPDGYITSSALSPYVPYTYASSTFPSFGYASSTFTSFTYATNTFATIANYPTYTYASSTFPSFTYASATYYLATNPSGYITSSALSPYLTSATAATTYPSFAYASSTYLLVSASTSLAYIPFASSTLYVPYSGATGNVDLNAKNLIDIAHIAYTSASGTALTLSGNLVEQATSTLATTSATQLSLGDGLTSSFLSVDANGKIIGTTTPLLSLPLTTKGDLLTYNSGFQKLGVSTDGSFLIASSSATNGLAWQTLPGGTNCLDDQGGIIGVTGSGDCATLGGNNTFTGLNVFQATSTLATTSATALSATTLTVSATSTLASTTITALQIATTTNQSYPLVVGTSTAGSASAYFGSGIMPRTVGYTASTSITINTDILDIATTTVQYSTTTFQNPIGTAHDMQPFALKMFATTSQNTAWGSLFASTTAEGLSSGMTLPASVGAGTTMLLFVKDASSTLWVLKGN